MMGIKRDTKTFSTSPQNETTKSEGANNLSAQDMAKLSGEDVGDLLNKVSDPNWVDPSKKARAVGSDKMDKDAFMKMMLAQMKNQDPTNPLKSHEMAAQLAQFSQLEQLQNVNTTLEQMKMAQKPSETYQSLNFIGKSVAGDAARIYRGKGDKNHDFNFTLPEDAKEVSIKVRNSQGDIVRAVKLPNMRKGENSWSWNGQTENGTTTPVGDYQLLVEAKAAGAGDKKLSVKTDFDGVITGVNYTPEGPVLLVGNQSIKLKDVRKIVDPATQKKDQNAQKVQSPDLKKLSAASENEVKGAEEVPIGAEQPIMEQVGLSREMMNKLEKETKPQAVAKPETKTKANGPSPSAIK